MKKVSCLPEYHVKSLLFTWISCEKSLVYLNILCKVSCLPEYPVQSLLLFEYPVKKSLVYLNILCKSLLFTWISFEKVSCLPEYPMQKSLVYLNNPWKFSCLPEYPVKKSLVYLNILWKCYAEVPCDEEWSHKAQEHFPVQVKKYL